MHGESNYVDFKNIIHRIIKNNTTYVNIRTNQILTRSEWLGWARSLNTYGNSGCNESTNFTQEIFMILWLSFHERTTEKGCCREGRSLKGGQHQREAQALAFKYMVILSTAASSNPLYYHLLAFFSHRALVFSRPPLTSAIDNTI
jgi:hypothetical protein